MFASVLVANRAEIACRIFRTARAMGMTTVAVYSDADAKAKHVREADRAVHIGPAPASESYLRGDKIIAAAQEAGAEAIHPGYGFLSENPDFAQAVIDAGLIWIGPTPAAIRAMGLKDEAKRIAEEAGVPVVPGYRGDAQDAKTLAKAAKDVGFPVLIKAIAGGGGRGIREVNAAGEFAAALESARREASAAFGDDRVIVEKLIQRPRHIEVQVFGDKHGNLVHLYERDCSLQRRRQKVIEEAPAPGMTDEVRAAMTDAALKVARAVNYENAGTVEYVVDGTGALREDGFWFLEMNTRLQVEHPVTEAVTGLDLVEWQFRVAAGEKLPKTQDEIELNGHAIEARLCAEDPSEGFRPSVGRLERFDLIDPRGRGRVDAGYERGDVISSSYDSLIAKLVVHSKDRETAITRCGDFLDHLRVFPLKSNGGFLRKCLRSMTFVRGVHHVGAVSEEIGVLTSRTRGTHSAALAAACLDFAEAGYADSPWDVLDGWRANGPASVRWRFKIDDEDIELVLSPVGDPSYRMADGRCVSGFFEDSVAEYGDIDFEIDGQPVSIGFMRRGGTLHVFTEGDTFTVEAPGASREHADSAGGDVVKAPLPGKVVAICAKAGAAVKKGEPLVTLEAMKMEHQLKAPRDGIIAEIAAEEGAQVKEGALLVRLAEEEAA
ncbi:MAG: biotin/lipoyl-binding protein [Alphaproteobacteria bacterium]|nr:biotin/lipoyl-binding protein [Alphaproteobacteria bacterium]